MLLVLISTPITGQNPSVLIQLFTSQGCSSCPPADDTLSKIQKDFPDKNVHVLSYHVDYWNRLGWKDSFSSEYATQKQYAYADQFGNSRVYTPQAIINGTYEFVGSDESKIKATIHKVERGTNRKDFGKISWKKNNGSVYIGIEKTKGFNEVYASLFVKSKTTKIKAGENTGKTLVYTHVVADERPVQNKNAQLEIPEWVENYDQLGLMIYAHDSNGQVVMVREIDI